MTSFKYLLIEVKDRIGILTLNRPEKRNALNFVVIKELKEALALLESDDYVKLILLRGNGPAFCSGADLEYLQKLQGYGFNENLVDSTHLMELYLQIYRLRKLVLAQIEGPAVAGGCGLATLADFSFAVPEAKFGYTEVKIGFIPAIVMVFLLRKVGEGKAKELLLTGDLISATRALELGIINQVVAKETIQDHVWEFAQRLCQQNSQGSMEFTKRMIADVQQMPLVDALNFAAKMNAHARDTVECRTGIRAFLNKENLQW